MCRLCVVCVSMILYILELITEGSIYELMSKRIKCQRLADALFNAFGHVQLCVFDNVCALVRYPYIYIYFFFLFFEKNDLEIQSQV